MKTRRAEAIWIDSRSRWQINVQRDGVRKTFTDSTPGRIGKHEAEAKADKWLRKFSTEQVLEDAWAMFLEDKKDRVTTGTYNQVSFRYSHITAVIPERKRLSMITIYEWQKVLDNLASKGYSANTVSQTLATIKDFNTYALRRRWECEEIRTGDLEVPKTSAKPKAKQALSEASLKALFALDDIDDWYIYLYQFLPLTGLRIGEARALQWSDVDTDKHVLHLQRAFSADDEISTGKTNNAMRNIPLIQQAETVLLKQRELLTRWHLGDSELIFPCDKGGAMTKPVAEYHWKLIAKMIKTDCTIHELRHTFISISKSELPLALLKQVAGHSATMDTLKVYGHETEKDLQTSLDLLSEAFVAI